MRRFRTLALLSMGMVAGSSLDAQNLPGYGWSSLGVLPFRGYDFLPVQTPGRLILYYTRHSTATITEGPDDPLGRASSTDLKNWTVETGDICAASVDLCVNGRPRNVGVLTLADGRHRMFLHDNDRATGVSIWLSAISSDGLHWTRESGTRFTADPASIFERSNLALAFASFVTLPEGSVRAYYSGGIVPGTAGTPAYYNQDLSFNGVLLKQTGAILSAVSKDNGLTWTREPGVRINPLVQGPVRNVQYFDRTLHTEVDASDVSAVAVKENGRTVYRIYCPSWSDGAVSYVSDDGLSFTLEGQVPADRGDPKAIVLPDGRTWLISNQYPDGIDDTIVYGPQSLFLGSTRAVVTQSVGTSVPNGLPNPFQAATLGVTGSATGPVALEAVAASVNCASSTGTPCPFRADDYTFAPASGTAPLSTVVSYRGPATNYHELLVVHATAGNTTAAGAIYCMNQALNRSDTSVFCKAAAADLPMNRLSFAFLPGGPAAAQVSNVLSLGGPGYPFTATSSVPWATVSPASGTAPAGLTVRVNPAGLAAGTYSGVVTVSAEGTTQQIAVSAVVSGGPVISSVRNAASLSTTLAPGSFLTIFGSGFAVAPVVWSPTTSLPATLGGVSVKIGGKDAYISYADPTQLNVLAPADLAAGTSVLQVTTAAGTASANVTLAPVAPSWFTYTVAANTWLAALFGNSATLVAPSGSLTGVSSRSARAGDILQFYANGLGATSPSAPNGVVLTEAYPLSDLARVRVAIGGKPATVLFAGLVAAGLFQLNVQVPAGVGQGELPIEMFVDGQPTQGGPTLNFQ
jgi:uncharacterized protein (TIGR03437 family)